MDFIGKICPYCKSEFKEGDDIVVCSNCEMPHHKECWIENKACTTFGCTGTMSGGEEQAVETAPQSKFCGACGAPMDAGQKFCSKCGNPANAATPFAGAAAQTMNQGYQQNTYTQQAAQYIPSQQYSQNSQYGMQHQLDPDFYDFLYCRQEYYVKKMQDMQNAKTITSWNWASFIFGAYWLAYRKMYAMAAAYVGVNIVLGLIPVLGTLASLAMSICAGLFGNHLYLQHVMSELQIAKTMDPYNKSAYINKKGKTNPTALLVVGGASIFCSLVISLLMSI